jgi:hypothetical protein
LVKILVDMLSSFVLQITKKMPACILWPGTILYHFLNVFIIIYFFIMGFFLFVLFMFLQVMCFFLLLGLGFMCRFKNFIFIFRLLFLQKKHFL